MNSSHVPGLIDAGKQFEPSITKTATYNGATLDLGQGYAPGGMGEAIAAVLTPTAVKTTAGNETYVAALYESPDNVTFTQCGPPIPITTPVVAVVPGFVSYRYLRVAMTLAGTAPSITYQTDFSVALN